MNPVLRSLGILVMLILLAALILWRRTPPVVEDAGPAEEPVKQQTPPASAAEQSSALPVDVLASAALQNRLLAEVTRVARVSDGLVEIRWRYRNPTAEQINLCSNDGGRELIAGVYCSAGGEKHLPVLLPSGKRLASDIHWTDVPSGQSVQFWAKFDVPATQEQIALFLPGTQMPMADLAVTAEPPPAPQLPADVLAVAPHLAGLVVEVLRVQRTKDDLVEIRWRYRNPSKEAIHLFSSGDAEVLPSRIFLLENTNRKEYPVHRDADGAPTATKIGFTNIAAGQSVTLFARFSGPPITGGSLTFYVPDTLPLGDLTE